MKQTLILTVFLLLFVISCAAQSNSQKSVSTPKAQKVAEVLYFCNTELNMRIGGFVKILRKTPSAKVYVIVYPNPKIVEWAGYLVSNTSGSFGNYLAILPESVYNAGWRFLNDSSIK